jgi:hypothetical protein
MISNWKADLKRMKLDHIAKTAPGFFLASGGYSMEVAPYRDNTANSLSKAIMDWLRFRDWLVTRKGDCIRASFQGKFIKIRVAGYQDAHNEPVDFLAKDMVSFLHWFNQQAV